MKRNAIAYTADIILGRTGEVISRDSQKEQITKYAAAHDIEIVAWFEDEMYNEDVLSRPGVKAMLACDKNCDLVLVERVWAFSRSWKTLCEVFGKLDSRSVSLDATTTMWDCVSQMARHRFDKTLVGPKRAKGEAVIRNAEKAVTVRRPEHLHFAFVTR